jgi:hypothetical protein
MNDQYFKSIKKDYPTQQELFEISDVAMSVDPSADFTENEKMSFEEELVGIVFTGSGVNKCELCGFLRPGYDFSHVLDKEVYHSHDFTLYASMEKNDITIMDKMSEFLSEDGNCSVKLYFSDTKQTVSPKGKIDLNDLTFYKLKLLLKQIPFYVEINSSS